jgi:hypothetical protein
MLKQIITYKYVHSMQQNPSQANSQPHTHVTEFSAYFQVAFVVPRLAVSEVRVQNLNIFQLVKKSVI